MSFYFSGNVVDQNLIPVIGAEVYVYANGELATGLLDALGAPLSNPLRTVANGFYEAYSTQGGSHVLRIRWGGIQRYVESIGEAVIQGPVASKTITGTTYTLLASDAYKVLYFTSNSAITVTLPSDTVAAYPLNAGFEAWQKGNGAITFVAGAGATIESLNNLVSTAGRNACVGGRKNAANTFSLAGALA